VNVTFYGVFQLRDLNVYQPVVGFSIFSAAAALLLCCLWPLGLIYQAWSFISEYPKLFVSIRQSQEYILTKEDRQRLQCQNAALHQQRKIDMADPSYPTVNGGNALPFETR
jgi:hypothetical protein